MEMRKYVCLYCGSHDWYIWGDLIRCSDCDAIISSLGYDY